MAGTQNIFLINPASTDSGHSIITYRTATLFMYWYDVGMRFKRNTDIDFNGTYTCFRGQMSTDVNTWTDRPGSRRVVAFSHNQCLENFPFTVRIPPSIYFYTIPEARKTSIYWWNIRTSYYSILILQTTFDLFTD